MSLRIPRGDAEKTAGNDGLLRSGDGAAGLRWQSTGPKLVILKNRRSRRCRA